MVEIVVICDRSSSMGEGDKWTKAVDGFRGLVREQRTIPGEATLTLVLFNHGYELVMDRRPLAEVDEDALSRYEPQGTTALYDAIGRTLDRELGPRGIVAIVTDGEENASTEYRDRARIRELVAKVEAAGWQVHYLAAGEEAFKEAPSLGLNGQVFSNDAGGVLRSYGMASTSALRYRSGT